MLRIGIVAGESTGDILGAQLISSIRSIHPDAEFIGVAGPLMLKAGCQSLFDMERLAVMGLVEPLKRLPELLAIRKKLIEFFRGDPPDLFIGIDAPDFNLTLERKLKEAGIKTAHYVSPSVWAWRQGRIHTIKKSVDLMLTLLPFEADFYRQHHVPVEFVGHPLADEITAVNSADITCARANLGLPESGTLVALLPGSRASEVAAIGPTLWLAAREILDRHESVHFIVPGANGHRAAMITEQLKAAPDIPITLVTGQSRTVMTAADAVVMASGTTTLEAMLLAKPMVVVYKMAWLSYAILSRLVKSEFISLPNLLAGRRLVPELIQAQATPELIAEHVCELVESVSARSAMVTQFNSLAQQLRLSDGEVAARSLLSLISE
jgi:lipid-A-disaccharide synthase